MLKIRIFVILSILIKTSCYGQRQLNNENLIIHKLISKSLIEDEKKINIFPFTKKSSFIGFDFYGAGRGLDTISSKAWNKKEWIDFVKNIDTNTIEDYSIKKIIKSSSKKQNTNTQVVFGPVFISKDQTKALCVARFYSSNSGSSGTSWFCEKNNKVWKIIDYQVFIINH